MRISDWSSDVCSSDLRRSWLQPTCSQPWAGPPYSSRSRRFAGGHSHAAIVQSRSVGSRTAQCATARSIRSEEHTSELQSLMRISYAVFCLKKKKKQTTRLTEIAAKKNI